MKGSNKVDYIIVGQGLAGCAVALQLMRRRKRILVIDRPLANSSSRIAVGLFNPVTGRRVVKTWMADKIFPYLHTFYQEAEALTKQKFFYSLPLYRPFASIEEQNEWMAKSADPIYQGYIQNISTRSVFPSIKDGYGGLTLAQCGYLDTIQYIGSVRSYVQQEGTLLEEVFDEEQLIVGKKNVVYKGYEATHVVFCQGVETNKWFSWVPVLPLKGETIRIKSSYEENIILNRGVYAVPANQKGEWRVGATYTFTDVSQQTTDLAREELTQKMEDLVNFPFVIADQQWGLRPSTHDRRPILGRHPEYENLYILNGLGPKGVSLAPYFSGILVDMVENSQSLNKDVDVKRYKLLYWSPST
jgi:glycine/D-amino acid oxidase-like deaminating enzyme